MEGEGGKDEAAKLRSETPVATQNNLALLFVVLITCISKIMKLDDTQ
jgi:hypothetical protein